MTNDQWNSLTSGVGTVPVRAGGEVPRHGVPIPGVGWADPYWLAHLDKSVLGAASHVVPDPEMEALEDRLTDVMALADLLTVGAPIAPHAPTGPITYPRWGDVHWVTGFKTGGQTNRYVVVSHDHHNATPGSRPFVVRTTSQTKRNTQDFPSIQGGAAHACCGEAQAGARQRIVTQNRPDPASLGVADMARAARGIASVLELESAVVRAGGQI